MDAPEEQIEQVGAAIADATRHPLEVLEFEQLQTLHRTLPDRLVGDVRGRRELADKVAPGTRRRHRPVRRKPIAALATSRAWSARAFDNARHFTLVCPVPMSVPMPHFPAGGIAIIAWAQSATRT